LASELSPPDIHKARVLLRMMGRAAKTRIRNNLARAVAVALGADLEASFRGETSETTEEIAAIAAFVLKHEPAKAGDSTLLE
jgi:hypothetical protein